MFGIYPGKGSCSTLCCLSARCHRDREAHGLDDVSGSQHRPAVDLLLHRRQRRARAAAALPRAHQSCLSPVPGAAPAPPRRCALRRLLPLPGDPCPAGAPPARLRPPGPAAGQERHAAPPGGHVRGAGDGAQPDGRGPERGRRLLPHAAGRLLRAGGHAAHHPGEPVLPDERGEGALGQGAAPSQGGREEDELQGPGIHLGVLPGPGQRAAHQGGRAAGLQIIPVTWLLQGAAQVSTHLYKTITCQMILNCITLQ